MQKIRAVLFDVIGTTVLENDPELINSSFIRAFQVHSIPIDKAAVLAVRGRSKLEAIGEILSLSGHTQELKIEIFKTFEQNVVQHLSGFREHPELYSLVSFLRERKIMIGIGSGLPQSVFEKLVESMGWQKYSFDYSSTFEQLKHGRPDPGMINQMRAQCGVEKNDFLKVGDTLSDIEEGKNAGVKTAVILAGTQEKEILAAAGPTFILETLADIKRLFVSGH